VSTAASRMVIASSRSIFPLMAPDSPGLMTCGLAIKGRLVCSPSPSQIYGVARNSFLTEISTNPLLSVPRELIGHGADVRTD